MNEWLEAFERAEHHVDEGTFSDAFEILSPWLAWPRSFESDLEWDRSWSLFARIIGDMAQTTLADAAAAIAADPQDPNALATFGSELIEADLASIAATVLARAHEAAPGDANITFEFVHALEVSGFNSDARDTLMDHDTLLEGSFTARYLLAFNALMCRDVSTAQECAEQLAPVGEDEAFMARRIHRYLHRHDHLRSVSALDAHDLRGWRFVTHGSLLLHLSEYGYDEGMNGRYAFLQDQFSTCSLGLRRLTQVLDLWNAAPQRVWLLPDRDSRILGLAAARLLDVEAQEWPTHGAEEPGLIVAYDLSSLPHDIHAGLGAKRKEQILFEHASCWTDPPPFSADIQTLFHQFAIPPWGARMQVDSESNEVERHEPDARAAEEVADAIIEAPHEIQAIKPSFDSLKGLLEFAARAAEIARDDSPTALHDAGLRPPSWPCSPVQSNRFL